jgi:hypothetical protein
MCLSSIYKATCVKCITDNHPVKVPNKWPKNVTQFWKCIADFPHSLYNKPPRALM